MNTTVDSGREGADWSLVIHGGAGLMDAAHITPAREAAYRKGLADALAVGTAWLEGGVCALDVVQAVVEAMEANRLFNAGRGAVFSAKGEIELDAAIMDGATLKAGSVAGVRKVRHPIALARIVLDHSAHVMLIGEGAEAFAVSHGVSLVDPIIHFDNARWDALIDELKARGLPEPMRPIGAPQPWRSGGGVAVKDDHLYGTVGAVARDRRGHLAAATSTGGVTAKAAGRVGDSPIVGAGVYADDAACAISCTGTGEAFMRIVAAHEVSVRRYGRLY